MLAALDDPDPQRGTAAARRAGAAGHRHRLRRRDDPRAGSATHIPPRARSVARSSARSAAAAAARRSSPRPTPARSGPSVRAVVPVFDGGRVVALVSVGRSITAVTRDLPAAGARWCSARSPLRCCWPPRLVAGEPVAAALDPRPGPCRAGPDVRVLRRGAARRPRGPAAARPGRAGCSWSTTRRAGCWRCRADVHGRRVDEIGLPAALGEALADGTGARRRDPPDRRPDRGGEPGRGALGRPPPRHRRHPARPHRAARSWSASCRPCAASPTRCTPRRTRRPTSCTPCISLIELGRADEALEFATAELEIAQQLTDAVVAGIAVPEVAALVVGKAAEAGERGVELRIEDGIHVPAGRRRPARPRHDRRATCSTTRSTPRRTALSPGGCGSVPGVVDDAVELRVGDSGPGLARRHRRAGVRARLQHQAAQRLRPRARARTGAPRSAAPRRQRGPGRAAAEFGCGCRWCAQ